MRFGHSFYPMNFEPSRDCDAIEECLLEAELASSWVLTKFGFGAAMGGDGSSRDGTHASNRGPMSQEDAASSLRLLSEMVMLRLW